MKTDIIYGYGFEIHGDNLMLASFIKNHKDIVVNLDNGEKLLRYIEENEKNDEMDILDYYDATKSESAYNIIADVMTTETGVFFQYAQDESCDEAILFSFSAPWFYNDTEKVLNEEKLEKIVDRYVDELGIITTKGYLEIEYLG